MRPCLCYRLKWPFHCTGSGNVRLPAVYSAGCGRRKRTVHIRQLGQYERSNIPPDFDPSVTYSGGLSSSNNYNVSSDGWRSPRSFRSGQPTRPSIYCIKSDQGQSARYPGNYLNWCFFHATDQQRAEIPLITRVQTAKAAVSDIVSSVKGLRYGVMEFNYDNGGKMIADIGTDTPTLLSIVANIAANDWTPLAETLVSAMDELKQTGADAPFQYACQKTFIVMVTDGLPTKDTPTGWTDYDGDGNEPGSCSSINAPYNNSLECSDWVDDIAGHLKDMDLRSDLEGTQNAITYVIGFAIDAPLLQDTADNGGGLYMNANDPDELQQSLESVLRDIVDRISSGSAVAVVSTEGEDQNYIFRGKFMPGKWRGFLEAFALPYQAGVPPVWEAGQLLADAGPNSRQVFTSVGGTQVPFIDSFASFLQPALGVADEAEAINLINWTLGADVNGMRDRGGWILGDIVDSSPVVVGAPSAFSLYNNYLQFRDAHADRKRMIYIGANDGMIHAFDAETGDEKWAYIPSNLLDRLQNLADENYCHEFFCNLTPYVVDAEVNGTWHTMMIAGEKQGGGMYVALDVTYPENPVLMWETEIPEIGESWARPTVFRSAGLGKYIAVFGSGPDYTAGEAYVVAVDLETGQKIWQDHLGTRAGVNMSTAVTTVDLDFDGFEDMMYVADLDGNLWRYDLALSPPAKSLLFSTNGQPIQAQPIVTVDYNNDVFLYFGTGKYMDGPDIANTDQQTFYSIIDNHSGVTASRSDLVDQTYSISEVGGNARGWLVDLNQQPGERVTEPDALVSGIVYFTTFAPTDEVCSAGGHSWLYAMKFRNGGGYDDDDDDSNDTIDNRIEDIGEGISTKPVIDLANEDVIIQGSDTRIHVRDAQGIIRQLIVRSWRQMYN